MWTAHGAEGIPAARGRRSSALGLPASAGGVGGSPGALAGGQLPLPFPPQGPLDVAGGGQHAQHGPVVMLGRRAISAQTAARLDGALASYGMIPLPAHGPGGAAGVHGAAAAAAGGGLQVMMGVVGVVGVMVLGSLAAACSCSSVCVSVSGFKFR